MLRAFVVGLVACSGLVVAAGCGATKREAGPGVPRAAESTPAPPRLEVVTAHRVRESNGAVVATLGARQVVFVADADDARIRAFDASTLEPLATTELPSPPRHLLVAYDGRVFATMPETNAVVQLEPRSFDGALREVSRVATSVEPLAMALTPEEDRLLVVTGASHRLDTFDAHSLAKGASYEVAREPRAVLVENGGGRAWVSHASAGMLTSVALGPRDADAKPADGIGGVDLSMPFSPATKVRRPRDPRRDARHGYALVRARVGDVEAVVVPVVQSATSGASPSGYGADPFDGLSSSMPMMPVPKPVAPSGHKGDMELFLFDADDVLSQSGMFGASPLGLGVFDVRLVDTSTQRTVPRIDQRFTHGGQRGDCLLPRAAIATSESVVVACAGQSEVVAFRTETGWPTPAVRIAVPRGPSALARVPATSRAVVWSSLSRTLALVDVSPARGAEDRPASTAGSRIERRAALLEREVERTREMDAAVAAGREIFHRTGEAAISRDGVACASCHPDGRDDGLVWPGPRGRRHSLTLTGNVARTGVFGWGGEHPTLEAHVKETIQRLGGSGLPVAELASLMAYLRAMKPLPVAEPRPEGQAARGAAIFRSDRAACGTCHLEATGFTDHEAHDVGSGGMHVTPSLVGTGARTSWFHDGRFMALDTLLRHSSQMGGGSRLADDEREALASYLRTL